MANLFTLFIEFFKTGLFALGGGLATIPFLQEMMNQYHWFTESDLLNMIAVSESTPGPIGINMATYVGFLASGKQIIGALIATCGLVLPSLIIICIVANILDRFKDNPLVENAFYGIRPAVCALIFAAGISVFVSVLWPDGLDFANLFTTISWPHILLILFLFGVGLLYKKIHPILIIVLAAAMGILFSL